MKNQGFTPHHFNIIQGLKNKIYLRPIILKNGGGFTLIELLIYIAIVGTILVLMTGFFWNIALGYIKENSYQELQQNGRFALMKMEQEIKKARGIIAPMPGSTANNLSLEMANPSLNPTIFDLNEGKLRITQGTNPFYELTTDRVVVGNLQFTNLSYTETPGTVRIEMVLSHLNPGGLIEYQASINLTTTVSLFEGGASP